MKNYRELLEGQLQELEQIEKRILRNKERWDKCPEGRVRFAKNHGVTQCYIRPEGEEKYHFVPKAEWPIVKKTVQRDYERMLLKRIERTKSAIKKFLKQYEVEQLGALYEDMAEGRKQLVRPFEKPVEKRISEWMEEHPGSQNPYPMERTYKTERGELVRSKSEKIIADLLYKMKIPYQYEPYLCINGYHTVYPDFAIYDVKRDDTVYWEHFGMIDKEEYAVNAFRKIAEYENNEIFVGQNLIMSMETTDQPLDIDLLKQKMHRLLAD
ncbi:MAG: hypothetical protein E7280_00300 [Lachnospiraceae bacterium]|nr:hypothetical protein [Lachnospiraceae bacterium]